MRSKQSLNLFLAVWVSVEAFVITGCGGNKDPLVSLFDMAEYRKMIEEQKTRQENEANATSSTPEMSGDEHERVGDAEAQRGNYPLAAIHYSKALKADSGRNSVRLKLGLTFLQQGLTEPALTQFQDLLKREPNSAPAFQGIGHVSLLQGKLPEAETALQKSIALDPDNWEPHNLLGLVYDQQHRHSEAIAAYLAALEHQPREPSVLNNLGLSYALSGDHESAVQAYEQAVAAGSTALKLYNNLGISYVHRRRYADAFNAFKQATDEPRAYNNLGVALLGVGSAKKAETCFEKAIELNPQYYEKASENLRFARQTARQTAKEASTSGMADTGSCP